MGSVFALNTLHPIVFVSCICRGDREPIAALYAIGSDEFPVPQLPDTFPPEARDFVSLCLTRWVLLY